MKYYDVHVFLSRNNGYSFGVAIDTTEDFLTDEEVIEHAVNNNLFTEQGDEIMVDSVDEITESEFVERF